jgi:hypothetical protein
MLLDNVFTWDLLTEDNVESETKITEKVNLTDKYTEQFDSFALLPENKSLMELWNLARSITIFKIIFVHKLKIINQKSITFIDEISNKIKLEYIPEKDSKPEINNIIGGGIVITLLDKVEFKVIAYENKELIGKFLRSMSPCTSKLLKICIENFEEFSKIPKIKNLLLKNEHFRLFIGRPTYTDDVLFDRFNGEYIESICKLSNRKDIIPLFQQISKAIINSLIAAFEVGIRESSARGSVRSRSLIINLWLIIGT